MKAKLALLLVWGIVESFCCSQDGLEIRRSRLVKRFAKDLKNVDVSNQELFETYLTRGNAFASDTTRKMAEEIAVGLRASIQQAGNSDFTAYKYLDHREFGGGIRRIDDTDPDSPVEQKPLEFELHDAHRKNSIGVDLEDLYVLKVQDVRLFILFDDKNKIVSFISMQKGNTVALMKL